MLAAISLQVGLQPVLTRTFVTREVDKRSVILFVELGKIIICGLSLSSAGDWLQGGGTTLKSIMLSSVPAAVYLVQNLAMQVAYQRLDSVTFNCLNQTKIGFTAGFLFLLMGQGQTIQQLVALGLLSVAAAIVQSPPPSKATSGTGVDVTTFQTGVAACLLASLLSGLSATLTQRLAQGAAGKNSQQLTMEMAAVTVPVLLGDILLRPEGAGVAAGSTMLGGILRGWTWGTLLPVITSASGGVVVGMVTKRLGGIAKGFAIVGGLVLTGILQSISDGQILPARPLLALLLVLLSTWMHSSYPWRPPALKAKKDQ